MSKIIGITAGTPVPQADWEQTDSNKADYIKNKPDLSKLEVPIASSDTYGIVKVKSGYGIDIKQDGYLRVACANGPVIKERKDQYRPITPHYLEVAVKEVIADVMNSMVRTFWDGDVWGYDDGTDVSVSEDNLHNVKGEFVGQIIIIKDLGEMIPVAYMYLGNDGTKNYWTKLNAV